MEDTSGIVIDEAYEFSAPRYFDFVNGESEGDAREAEIWFDIGPSHAPSPFMPRIKISRSSIVATLCDFNEAEQLQNVQESKSLASIDHVENPPKTMPQVDAIPSEIKNKEETSLPEPEEETKTSLIKLVQEEKIELFEETLSVLAETTSVRVRTQSNIEQDACFVQPSTPTQPMNSQKMDKLTSESKKRKSAQKIANFVRNPSALKLKMKSKKTTNVKRDFNVKINGGMTPSLSQENQAIKRQKLEGGKSRQILNVKPQILPHKSRLGRTSGICKLNFSSAKNRKEDRKVYVRERAAAAPFISAAEMMKKFQSSTREMSISHMKPLTLTRPKEPDFETSQRIRSTKIKSTAELEEEMMAKMPRFKARPVNKKILEASRLPPLPRSTPQIPEFQEFHFETMSRANKNVETSRASSSESCHKNNQLKFHLTQPKSPRLQTSLRARSTTVKSSFELEMEEIEKAPKFKAKPLNKKIFESKGELGMFCNTKKQVTVPHEFHFATDARIPQPVTVFDLFDKISLNSESRHDQLTSRITTPNPFNLHTEARGVEKGRRFVVQVTQKQLEEEKARIQKANPYPCTTDFPVVPPKPEPKHWTNPKPFRLESLVRHEEETRKDMEERKRLEKEEAEMRLFKALPIMKEDPIPIPEKVRKPLTEVKEFNLNIVNRAVERSEFEKKIKEKEIMHKRYRDESESSRMMEEEKALKQMRRTMVPHARPLPKFDQPFMPRKTSKETTKAKSPNLRVLRRKDNRRITTTSSSSANMR